MLFRSVNIEYPNANETSLWGTKDSLIQSANDNLVRSEDYLKNYGDRYTRNNEAVRKVYPSRQKLRDKISDIRINIEILESIHPEATDVSVLPNALKGKRP